MGAMDPLFEIICAHIQATLHLFSGGSLISLQIWSPRMNPKIKDP